MKQLRINDDETFRNLYGSPSRLRKGGDKTKKGQFYTDTRWLERLGGASSHELLDTPKIDPLRNSSKRVPAEAQYTGQEASKAAQTPAARLKPDKTDATDAPMLPASQVGEKRRASGLRGKDQAGTAAERPRPATLKDLAQKDAAPRSDARNSDFEVETIRGLNRSLQQYSRGEGGRAELLRSVDYEKMPGMGERMVYDSTDPAFHEGLKYKQDQQHDITLKELENRGRLDEQALRNKGMAQRQTTADTGEETYKLSKEISKALNTKGMGDEDVDFRAVSLDLAKLRAMDEAAAQTLFKTMSKAHRERILDFWRTMEIIK